MFKFTLAAALVQRRTEEQRARALHARARNVARALSTERHALTSELDSLGAEFRAASILHSPRVTDAWEVMANRTAWILEAEARVGGAQAAVEADLAQAEVQLAHAVAARRGLELLEERRRANYRRRIERLEAQELDDANAARAGAIAVAAQLR